MNMTKKTLTLAVVAASVLASAPAMAEITGNVGAVSNYLWRGVSQSGDQAAVQGGIDYSHASGIYVGTWASSLSSTSHDYEDDVYAGYKFEVSGVGIDVGVIDYTYPIKTPGLDDYFVEGYVGATLGNFSAKVSHSPDVILTKGAKNESATYVEAAYGIPVGDKSTLSLHAGNYSGDGAKTLFGATYSDFSVSITKDAFTFGVSKTSGIKQSVIPDANDTRIFVGYKTSLGL